jgi:hypothetical protein
MVLIDDQQPQPTIPRWIAEIASFEREADGTVRRGHKWLQRLERAREQRWLSSLGPEARVHASQLPVERRQLLAALHRLESTMAPSARAMRTAPSTRASSPASSASSERTPASTAGCGRRTSSSTSAARSS